MKKILKNKKAITLISLVITIVVLIILASVAIYLSLGNNGIFTRAKEAKGVTNKQEATDIISLKITTAQINKYAERQEMPTLKELSLILKDDNEIEYVTESSKLASIEYNVPSENPSSIYTKLNKYTYEFEINDRLQLASIDGIKIANKDSTKGNPSTILYPNGTEENPGTITINQRIEIENPYPGHTLYLVPQINIEGLWGEPKFIYNPNYGAMGIGATQLEGEKKDLIIVQSGSFSLKADNSVNQGDGFGTKNLTTKSAQFRLKVVCVD